MGNLCGGKATNTTTVQPPGAVKKNEGGCCGSKGPTGSTMCADKPKAADPKVI